MPKSTPDAYFFVVCASAKSFFSQSGIFRAMDTSIIDIHLTVEEILQKWPHTFSVFMKNKTKCVGCLMQRFCTLKDVAEMYQLPLENLIEEIRNVSNETL